MKKPAFRLLSSLALLVGCASEPGFQGAPIEPASIGKILLRVPPENLSISGFTRSRELAEQIGKNLAGWGYPIVAGETLGYSHIMEARVSGVERKSTPTGLSFSLGNSDPQALEFQKADVVTVTCTLHSRERPTTKAYLKEGFVADSTFKGGESSKNDPALFNLYVDHIGTTCFNLLSELHVSHTQPAPTGSAGAAASTGTSSSNWFPEVQVEVRRKPAPSPKPSALPAGENRSPSAEPGPAPASAAPAATGIAPSPATEKPLPPPSSVDVPPETRPAPSGPPEPPPPAEPSPVRTETQQGEGRKQIIIHNQGNPVILEFGYERR